jgi:hypothetical protein
MCVQCGHLGILSRGVNSAKLKAEIYDAEYKVCFGGGGVQPLGGRN